MPKVDDATVTRNTLDSALSRSEATTFRREAAARDLVDERARHQVEKDELRKQLYLERIAATHNLNDERFARLNERDASSKEAVRVAMVEVKAAGEIVRQSLVEFKAASNEWRSTVTSLVENMPTKDSVIRDIHALDEKFTLMIRGVENKAEGMIRTVETKAESLQLSQQRDAGRDEAVAQSKRNQTWIIGLVVTIVLFIIGQAAGFLK